MTRILAAVIAVAILACSTERTSAPEIVVQLHTDPGLLISDAIEVAPAPSGNPSSSVWVSLLPGTVPTGTRAEVRRPGRTTFVGMVDGGFDPAEIKASLGDTVEVAIYSAQRLETTLRDIVRPAQALRIVRTSPPSSSLGVHVEARIRVVFSEPIDPASISSATFRLRRGTVDLDFQVIAPEGDVSLELFPIAGLAPGALHTLEITTGLRDLGGQGLPGPALVTFTTGG